MIVLSKEVIEGIKFWEVEVSYLCLVLHFNWKYYIFFVGQIGGKTGYVEATSVEEYSVMCTHVEVVR